MKQAYPSLPTLFDNYIEGLKDFLQEHSLAGELCLILQVLISILLFVDDVLLSRQFSS